MLTLIARLAVSVVAQTSGWLQTPLTLDANALPAHTVLEQVSQLCGTKLTAVDSLRDDILILHLEKVTVKQLMDKMADIDLGVWEKVDNGYQIRRSSIKMAAEAQLAYQKEVKFYAEALRGERSSLAKVPVLTREIAADTTRQMHALTMKGGPSNQRNSDYWMAINRLQEKQPGARCAKRLLLLMPPETLAAIPNQKRTVFAINPTPMQHALPDGVSEVVDDLVREQVTWNDAAKQYGRAATLENGPGQAFYDPSSDAPTLNGVGKVLLILNKYGFGTGIQAELKIADMKGKVLLSSNTYLSFGERGQTPPAPTASNKEVPSAAIPLSPQAKEAYAAFNSMFGMNRKETPHVSPALKAILDRPDLHDPLGLFVAEGMIDAAKMRHENLFVLAEDILIYYVGSCIKKDAFECGPLLSGQLKEAAHIKEEEGWISARPSEYADYEKNRANRKALAELLRAIRSADHISVDVLAEYALANECEQFDPFVRLYLSLLTTEGDSTLSGNPIGALRFYGTLSPIQRRSTTPITIPFVQLSLYQIRLLNEQVFDSYPQIQYQPDPPPQVPGQPQSYNYEEWNSLKREPTEILPNGLPRDGSLTVTFDASEIVSGSMQYGDYIQPEMGIDLSQLAWMITNPENQGGGKVISLRAAHQDRLTFDFHFTRNASQAMSVQDIKFTGKMVSSPDQLPDSLRKQLAELVKQYRQLSAPSSGGSGSANAQP